MYSSSIENLPPEDQAKVQQVYFDLFNSPGGRVVLEDLMHAHFITGPAMPNQVEYCEAQRNVVLRILALSRIPLTLG